MQTASETRFPCDCIELRKAKDEAVRERSFLRNLFRFMPMGYIRMTMVRDAAGLPCD